MKRWNYPSHWPPKKYFVDPSKVTNLQKLAFRELIEKTATEKGVDTFLRSHPDLLAACLNFTAFGHHGCWVIPQQEVRPTMSGVEKGLKPDYIIGGKGSGGFSWYVVELKGVKENIFSEKKGKLYFSSVANRGVFQLLEYIDYCSSVQAYFRDTLGLTDFREPQGFLIIGRETEFSNNSNKERLKAAWNRMAGDTLEVRTYDALLRSSGSTYHSNRK